METFANPYTNDTIVLQQRIHNPNLWEVHQNGEWIGAADYHDLLVAKLERNGFVAQSQPEPTKEEFASVVIPPDAFGKSALTIVPAIVEREYVDLEFVTSIQPDDDADLSWLDQSDDAMGEGFEEHANDRKDAYQRGDWHMVGVVVEAILTDQDGRTEEFCQSVWCVESDSGKSYFSDLEQELTRELVSDLTKFGLEYEWIALFSDIIAGDLAAQRGEVLALAAD